jgi:hypothetical protein
LGGSEWTAAEVAKAKVGLATVAVLLVAQTWDVEEDAPVHLDHHHGGIRAVKPHPCHAVIVRVTKGLIT